MEHNKSEESQVTEFEELLRRARSGDELALSLILENHRNYLLLIANQDLDQNMKGKLGSSDVVQESMLTAHQHFEQFHGGSKPEFLAWLRKILSNDLYHARRTYKGTQKRQVDREQRLQLNSSLDVPLVDPQLTPSTNAIAEEESQLVKNAMKELPEDYRQVLELHSWQHQSFEEIGLKIGKSAEAVRKIWTRAILKLQQVMAKKQILE